MSEPTAVARSDVLLCFSQEPHVGGYYIKVTSRYPLDEAAARGEEYAQRIRPYLMEGVKLHIEVEPSRFRPQSLAWSKERLVQIMAREQWRQKYLVDILADNHPTWDDVQDRDHDYFHTNDEAVNDRRIQEVEHFRRKAIISAEALMSAGVGALPPGTKLVCAKCNQPKDAEQWLCCEEKGCPVKDIGSTPGR